MQLEWNRYVEGLRSFKENQGMLWLICLCLFWILWRRKVFAKQSLFAGSAIIGICVLCPITAMVLLKGFTPFYNWIDLQQLFPLTLLTAVFGTELFFFLRKQDIPGFSAEKNGKTIISASFIIIILLVATSFHAFDPKTKVQENGIPQETAHVFEGLQNVVGDKEILLAAPNHMLQYVRLFDADWHPVYGRDLYSSKSASYINSGYDKEYQYYDIFSKDDLPEERAELLTSLINEGTLDCIIIPDFWQEYIGDTPDYDMVHVTEIYIGIIKRN